VWNARFMVRSPMNGNPIYRLPYERFGIEINRSPGLSARVINPARLSAAVAIIAILGAVTASLEDPAKRSIGVAIAVVAIVCQHRIAGAVSAEFSTLDWRRQGDEFVLSIPHSFHGRRHPTVQVFSPVKAGTGALELVITDVREMPDRTILVCMTANNAGEAAIHNGRVRIG